jgi:hypothetical protein
VAHSLTQLLSLFFKIMASIFDRVSAVLSRQSSVIADLREQLAAALANDASDAETIRLANEAAAAARAEADAFAGRVTELQNQVQVSQAELDSIGALIAPYEPAPEPPVDPVVEA